MLQIIKWRLHLTKILEKLSFLTNILVIYKIEADESGNLHCEMTLEVVNGITVLDIMQYVENSGYSYNLIFELLIFSCKRMTP
jgi:hypothetical protein